jgi:hypothetical protein
MEKHTNVEEAEHHIDSLGQRNPAIEMEKRNIEAANQRTEENEKLPGTPRSRALDQSWGKGAETSAPSGKKAGEDYDSMTVPELRDLAKERNIEVPWDARKDDLVDALKHKKG